jgi:hypothetical protein
MRGRSDSALEFVEMDHLEPIVAARIAFWALCGAKSGPQRQASNPTHAVDANFHRVCPIYLFVFSVRTLYKTSRLQNHDSVMTVHP